MHLDLLTAHLKERGKKVQLAAIERAIENGGFVSREEVYELGGYEPTRRLNNWTAPINNYSEVLVREHDLPDDADWPIETQYDGCHRSWLASVRTTTRVTADGSAVPCTCGWRCRPMIDRQRRLMRFCGWPVSSVSA